MIRSAAWALALSTAASAALAQGEGNVPNPLQGQNLVATCDSWPEQRRTSDPQAMQVLVGVWEGTGVMPGMAGIMGDTPYQFRTAVNPDGTFAQDRYGCFEMQSVSGYPSMGQSCAQAMIYGEWAAHFAADGSVAMVTLSSGSGFTGEQLPMSCAVSFYRAADPGTLMDQTGAMIRRVQ